MAIPKTLEDRLRTGKILPFVGAGVSKAVKRLGTNESLFPDWKQLLEKAADRLDLENKADDAGLVRAFLKIAKPNYLGAAEHARKHLNGAAWNDLLMAQFDRQKSDCEESSLDLPKAVWGLGSKLVITTNYDHALSWTCPSGQPNQWDIQAVGGLASALQNGVRHDTVWYLHGVIDNVSGLILSPDGYDRLYPDTDHTKVKYEAALDALRSVLASHSFLFIGYSLDDIHFVQELLRTYRIFEGASSTHYILVREEDERHVKDKCLPVETITFSGFGQPLVDRVRDLGIIAASHTVQVSHSIVEPQHKYDPKNPVFYVPYSRKGDQVIGREKALADVRRQLTEGKRTAIGHTAAFQGLGGLGKTQLAVEYAYEFKDQYPNGVIWITADQDIDAQLTDLAVRAEWIASGTEHKYKLDVAKHRLKSFSNCLIIFDNLEDMSVIEEYLPSPTAEPHILITSRTEHPGFPPVELNPLDATESLELLTQEAGRPPIGEVEQEAAKEIAEKLDGLPLALEIAGAFLQYRRTMSWVSYAELLRRNLKIALPAKFRDVSFTKHEADLYSTLKIDEEVYAAEPWLKPILDVLTWSGPSTMGISLLSALLDVGDTSELASALALGVSLRLLQKDPHDDRYAIHRLLREVRREEVPFHVRVDWLANNCTRLCDWFEDRRKDVDDLPSFEAEVDHLRAWQENATVHDSSFVPRLVWLQSYLPYHRGRYYESKTFLEKAMAAHGASIEREPLLHANLLLDLGWIVHCLGDSAAALPILQEALAIRIAQSPGPHDETANCLRNIADVEYDLENFHDAEKSAKAAHEMFVELSGRDSRGSLYSELVYCHAISRLGRQNIALVRTIEIIEIGTRLYGPQSSQVGVAYNIAGVICARMGDNRRALDLGATELAIAERVFGPHHPDVAVSCYNMGNRYHKTGQFALAFQYFRRALDIRIEMLGETHIETVGTRASLGNILVEQGDYEAGERELSCAVAICQERGYLNRTAVHAYTGLARALQRQGQGHKAFQLIKSLFDRYPKSGSGYTYLREQLHDLQRNATPRGFRQPSTKKQQKKQKKR